MDNQVMAILISTGSKLVSELIRTRPITIQQKVATQKVTLGPPPTTPLEGEVVEGEVINIEKPSTDETVTMLEARLNESLVALQPDLLDGARINGKACDCLKKHTDEMLATVRELQSMKNKPIYAKIRSWSLAHNWPSEKVAEYPPEYFVSMTPELRTLRKELSGSEPSKVESECPSCKNMKKFLSDRTLKFGSLVAQPKISSPEPTTAIVLPNPSSGVAGTPIAIAKEESEKNAESVADTVITRLQNLSPEDKAEIRKRLVARLKESEEAQ